MNKVINYNADFRIDSVWDATDINKIRENTSTDKAFSKKLNDAYWQRYKYELNKVKLNSFLGEFSTSYEQHPDFIKFFELMESSLAE